MLNKKGILNLFDAIMANTEVNAVSLPLHQLQRNVVSLRHSSHIENSITHASQGSVDAHTCALGNLTHEHHLALNGREHFHHVSHIAVNLVVHEILLDKRVELFVASKTREVAIVTGIDNLLRALLTIPIHYHIVTNLHQPSRKLA